ncbi:Arc family DNA-binding protein [Oscillospiraceae bacterium OttesenSCG-928-F05]|nr:Arc family DNA-binding protein [Oscillospiraceae bacterium OttesenSCG-928-F05]
MGKKNVTLHVDQEIHEKLQKIAEANARTVNGQITYIMKKEVDAFEKEHGKIIFAEK